MKKSTAKKSVTRKRSTVGKGGLKSSPRFGFARTASLVLVGALIGGLLVFAGYTLTSRQVVTSWYRTCLNREPDQGGFNYWTGRLDQGESETRVYNAFKAAANKTTSAYKDESKAPKQTTVTTQAPVAPAASGSSSSQLENTVMSFYRSCNYSPLPSVTNSGFQYWVGQLRSKSTQSVWQNFRDTSRNNGRKCADNIGGAVTGSAGSSGSTAAPTTTNQDQKRPDQASNAPSAAVTDQLEAMVASFYRSCSYSKVPNARTSSHFQYWVNELQTAGPKGYGSVWTRFREQSRINGVDCPQNIGGPIVTNNNQTQDTSSTTNPHYATVASFYKSCSYTNVPKSSSSSFQYWAGELKKRSKQKVWESFRDQSRKNGLKCAETIGGAIVDKNDGEKHETNPYVCNSPYPEIGSGTKNNSGGRKDSCVSAVQFNLAKTQPNVRATGVADSATVTAIRSFQGFFKQKVTGTLTPEQVQSIAAIWGSYKTDGTKNPTEEDKKDDKTTTGGGGYIDVVFIGRGGVSESSLAALGQRLSGKTSSMDPLSGYAFAFHAVTSTDEALGCSSTTVQTAASPMQVNNCANTASVLADAGVSADYIFIVSSSISRAHVSVGGAYVGTQTDANVLIHEFGHLLGLEDEYVAYDNPDQEPYAQCFKPADGSEEQALIDGSWVSKQGSWNTRFGSLDGVSFHKECNTPYMWRPSENSVMRQTQTGYFNSLSQRFIKQSIRQ